MPATEEPDATSVRRAGEHTTADVELPVVDIATRRRAEILCGAIRVIAREGVAAAKLKDIARESGVSLGLIQHYFDTRDNLVDTAFKIMMEVISHATKHRLHACEDPLQVIYATTRMHAHGTVAFPERWGFWTELWAASGRSDHARGVAKQVYELWARPLDLAFAQLDAEGRLPEGSEPAGLTISLLALMDGLAVRSLADPERFDATLMLRVLDEWTARQLGVSADAAAAAIRSLPHALDSLGPQSLTPEIVATTLLAADID